MPTYQQEAARLTQLGQRMTHGPSRVDAVTLADKDQEMWATVHGHHIDPETGLVEDWRLTMAAPAAISGSIVDVVEGLIRSHDTPPEPCVEPEAMAGHLSNFSVEKRGDVWTGCFSIETDVGPIRVCASADDGMIRQIVRTRVAQRAPMEASAGGFDFFKMIGDVTRKIARARILSRVARAFNDISKNPVISQLTGLAKFVPILGPAVSTAEQGGHLAMTHARALRARATARRIRQQTTAARPAARTVPVANRTLAGQVFGQVFGEMPKNRSTAANPRQQLAVQMARRMFNGS